MKRISYLIDLTKEYHNLLEKTEDTNVQTYFWDGNVALYEENGRRNYYLQDDLGSPIRIEGEDGILQETYGYGAFGEELYDIQEESSHLGIRDTKETVLPELTMRRQGNTMQEQADL